MTLRLFLLSPAIVFKARVNMVSATYPLDELTFDGVTVGAYGDIKPGMTLALGTMDGYGNRGRQRVRDSATATVIPVGRSSLGVADGELYVQDNAYITVWDDYRVWAKIPYIAPDGTLYKDSDIVVGTHTTNPPPCANAGPPAAGTIDSVTGQLQVMLPPVVNTSFATDDGATITGYQWTLPTGVTLAGGYADTDAQILVDCDPGFYWIELTVTDSNANTHTARTFVFARDPADDACISAFEIVEHRVTRSGQTVSVRITGDIPGITYPDGTLAVLMDGEPESLSVRDNMLFWGWHQTDPADISAERTGTMAGTILECVDVGGRLDSLPGFSQVVYNDTKRDATANPAITWAYMVDPTWDKLLHYLLNWHSTALEVADWTWTGTGVIFSFVVREAGGASLFAQVNRQCEALCPSYYLTCNRKGQLDCRVDPMLQDTGDRTSEVQEAISVDDWSHIRYAYHRPPAVHWLDDSAIVASATAVAAIFCHAPGDAPGQGEGLQTHGEQIAVSQDTLNATTGHRYARLNARESYYQIDLAESRNNTIDPARMEWVTLTITPTVQAQRGMAFTAARGLVHEMTFRYSHDRTGTTRQVTLLWERESSGYPAVTVIPATVEPVDDDNDPWPKVNIWSGSPKAYVFWDGAHVFRTWNIQDVSPTWEFVDTGITGRVFEGRYVYIGGSLVGMWLLTADGVWWCGDIFATTPSWSLKLSTATIQSTEEQPPVGNTIPISMATWGYDPSYLIVATGFDNTADSNSANWEFKHAYFWHTHDYGDTWTAVDTGATYTVTYGLSPYYERAYSLVDLYSMEMYRDADGIIYCARGCIVIGTQHRVAIFKSADRGHTWSLAATTYSHYNNPKGMALQHPYPDRTSPCFYVGGFIGVSARPPLYLSTDEFETSSIIFESGAPVGYGGAFNVQRPNTKPDDANHIVVWARAESPYNEHLMESDDLGVTWNSVYTDAGTGTNIICPTGTMNGAGWCTPNGWPSNGDVWFMIRRGNVTGIGDTNDPENTVWYTDDGFATWSDKSGDLPTLLGANNYTAGSANGFALPKVGVNA